MRKRILLLGHTGKMGTALKEVLADSYDIIGKNSSDYDAFDKNQVRNLIGTVNPDIVINTVAFLGIDPCEKEPDKAEKLNAVYPQLLAELSKQYGYLLVHFSTDAVFNDAKGDYYNEEDAPSPLNTYGATKYKGDCLVQETAECYYIVRIGVLFGETTKDNQFVEKMLKRVKDGHKELCISDDITSSPTYSKDVAVKIREMIDANFPFGLYHIVNSGKATLYELLDEIIRCCDLDVTVKKASFKDFPFLGTKNTNTPMTSIKIKPLRPWRDAVKEYCKNLGK